MIIFKKETIKEIENKLTYVFKDKEYLESALVHRSLSQRGLKSYERLEFLGDRVLGLTIASYLYRVYPNENEGALAKRHAVLVSGETCASISEKIGLGLFVKMTKGEEDGGGRKNSGLLADVCEAIIAAIYLDGGIKNAEKFILKNWKPYLSGKEKPPIEPKTALQEWAQSKQYDLPIYKVISEQGPPHSKKFKVRVVLADLPEQIGEGKSKKMAEQIAAKKLLKMIQDI